MSEQALRINPEWRQLSDRQNRYPNQFGEVLVPGINVGPEETQQLIERGAVFPMETAEPQRATFLTEQGDIFLPAK